jgi:hypothetical protein
MRAAEDAGMSRVEAVQAARVANVPEAEFERLVDSNAPPTVTQLAELGTKNARARMAARARGQQADALHIVAMADIRLANEYEAAQKRGSKRFQQERLVEPPSAADLGLSRKHVDDAR